MKRGITIITFTFFFATIARFRWAGSILAGMKTLIVHPEDETTKFLTGIYATLKNKTVITGGITQFELQKHIVTHDRVIMLGHGSPMGLLSVNQFPDCDSYIIDDSMVELLRKKAENIFVWCNADEFVHQNSLHGFYTGMFISEVSEAWYYDFWDVELERIEESNDRFSSAVSNHINDRLDVLYKKVIAEYGYHAKRNPIARFNLKRLYLTISELNALSDKVGKTYL